jgi:hypothetical protein
VEIPIEPWVTVSNVGEAEMEKSGTVTLNTAPQPEP